MRKQIALAAVLLSVVTIASAKPSDEDSARHREHHVNKVPEIDPSTAIAAVTLLGGGLAVIRGRRFKNSTK